MTTTEHPAWALSPYTRAALDALPAQVDEITAPPVIDEAICRLDLEAARIRNEIDNTIDALHIALGERGSYNRKTQQWPTTTDEILDQACALDPATPSIDSSSYPTIGSILNARQDLRNQLIEIDERRFPLAAQYRARGWTRVYLVDNDNGHAHRHLNCRNCYATTRYLWITEMSGATDAQVVDAAGERTCLTCYDSVRAEILVGRPCRLETRETRDERIARETVAAEKRAAKIAKGVTPDGSPLGVRLGGSYPETIEIKTERAAELRYVDLMAQPQTWEHLSEDAAHYAAAADEILAALAAKRETTVEALREQYAPKVAAKVKRERGY